MKSYSFLFFILLTTVPLFGQKTVEHSDSAFTVAPIPEFDKHIYKDQIRQWLDTLLVPVLDSLNLKADLQGEYGIVSDIGAYYNGRKLRIKKFAGNYYSNGNIVTGNDTFLFNLSISKGGFYIWLKLVGDIPVNSISVGEAKLHNNKNSEWFSLNKKDDYSEDLNIKLKDWKLQFDSFPPFEDDKPRFTEDFRIKGKLSFTTETLYLHKANKDKKGSPCDITTTVYFSIYRKIRNMDLPYDRNLDYIQH